MGGFRYFLGACFGVMVLTGCAPVNFYPDWIGFFNILVCLFLFGMPILVIIKLSSGGYTTEQKRQNLISAWGGIFAGFALLIIYMVWFPENIWAPPTPEPIVEVAFKISTSEPNLNGMILPTLTGMAIGFASLYALRKLASCWRLAGFFNLSVVAIILIIMVNVIGGNQTPVFPPITPGIGLGIFIHIILLPGTVTKFFE